MNINNEKSHTSRKVLQTRVCIKLFLFFFFSPVIKKLTHFTFIAVPIIRVSHSSESNGFLVLFFFYSLFEFLLHFYRTSREFIRESSGITKILYTRWDSVNGYTEFWTWNEWPSSKISLNLQWNGSWSGIADIKNRRKVLDRLHSTW